MADYREFNKAHEGLGAVLIAHTFTEQYEFEKLADKIREEPTRLGSLPHIRAFYFESRVLSDYTGTHERPRVDRSRDAVFRFEYTSIAFDIYWKAGTTTTIGDLNVDTHDVVDRIKVVRTPKR
jgi:hypothetical protein